MTNDKIKIKKSELRNLFKEIGETYEIRSMQLYDSFIKFNLKCKSCQEHSIKKLYFEQVIEEKKEDRSGMLPCKICGLTHENVHSYIVKYPNGSQAKCFPNICDNCLPVVKQRHPDLVYKKID